MNRFRKLVREIHRRSVWQVIGIYGFGSWISYQIILALTDGLGLPSWVPPLAFVLFLVGLPMVIATAIVQEGGPSPERLRRSAAQAATRARRPQQRVGGTAAGHRDGGLHRALTWPRTLLAGVAAFALLGLGTTGWFAMRTLGIGPPASLLAAGVVESSGQIVIADFRSSSGDTTLAAVVTEAFRIDFSRSTLVRPLAPASVQEILRRMGRDHREALDAELAREVAQRAGIGAIVTGDVTAAGGGYVLMASAVVAKTGEVVAAVRETARDSTQIIDAIDRLSRALRERTGESLRAIRRAEPLEQVTTSSLEALRKYTEGRRAQLVEGDIRNSRRLLEEAIALDSTFAAAHRAIAVLNYNNEDYEGAVEANDRALRFRDRLTEDERAHALGSHHLYRREYRDVIIIYETLLKRRPDDMVGLTGLGIAYKALGDFERSERWMRRSAEVDTLRFFGYANLGEALVLLGRFDEAVEAFDRATRLATTDPSWSVVHRAYLPWVQGYPDSAEAALRRVAADPEMSRSVQERSLWRLTAVLGARGRHAEADRLVGELVDRPENLALVRAFNDAGYHLFIDHDAERARAAVRRVEQVLADTDASVPRLRLAELCAWVEDVVCARAQLERSGYTDTLQSWAPSAAIAAHAALASAEGDTETAVRLYRRSASWRCLACEDAMVGRVFDRAGQPDSAAAAYRRFLETPAIHRYFSDWTVVPAMERLAELLEQRAESDAAAYWYARIAELWKDADPPLRPRAAAASARLAGLRTDR
jgi:eukaryotic-like serine/threonine-protein kinase